MKCGLRVGSKPARLITNNDIGVNVMKTPKYLSILSLAVIGALYGASSAWASPILGSDLATFAVLGGSTVTNTGPTTITGNVGDWLNPLAANDVTGFPPGQVSGTIYKGPVAATTTQALAHSQLAAAIVSLGPIGAGTTITGGNLDAWQTSHGGSIIPGVYMVPALASGNLTGTLILNGGADPNALWVFHMPTTLITSSSSVVNVINTGSGAGVFWDVGSSATLGTTTTFAGNILALTSITLDTGANILCGRALASNGAVTMDTNTISNDCSGAIAIGSGRSDFGSKGFSGGTLAAVPEPETYAMLLAGLGLLGFMARRRKNLAA
jgi:hypothetical protein